MTLYLVIFLIQVYQILSKQICVERSCYFFNNISSAAYLTFDSAKSFCGSHGATLAIINNRSIQGLLKNETEFNGITDEFYIGLKYIAKEKFIWENAGFDIPNLSWVQAVDTKKDACVFMSENGKMNMGNCSIPRNYICQNKSKTQSNESVITIGDCPNGFFKFANHCYRMNLNCSDEKYTWHQANDKCKSYTSSLVAIDSFQEQEFITALMTISPQPVWTGIVHKKLTDTISLWIDNSTQTMIRYPIRFKKGEPNGFQTRDEHCLMIYNRVTNIGYFNDELCNKSMNFICKTGLSTKTSESAVITDNPVFKSGKCAQKYYEFNETCYSIERIHKSYNDSKSYCEQLSHNMLKVYNDIHIAFLRSLMSFVGAENVWLSVREPDGTPNGVTWLLKETNSRMDSFNRSSCYSLTNGIGLGMPPNCNANNHVATSCYYFLNSHEESTGNTICPLNWKKVGQKCFKIISELQSFTKSIHTCELHNSILAQLQNMKEVQAIDREIGSDAWIGISGESYLKNEWLDGSSINYCLFRHTTDLVTIIKKDPKEICFVIRVGKAEWNDEKCESDRISVCQMPAIKSKCPDAFPFYVDGDCFGNFSDDASWENAEKNCQKRGVNNMESHLASFHNMEQENIVFSQIKNLEEHWIGLKKRDGENDWIDGSPYNYFKNPIPSLSENEFNCFTSQRIDRNNVNSFVTTRWSIVNCEIKRHYICRLSTSRKSPAPTRPPANLTKKYCPKEFFRFRESCFMLVNKTATWNDAKAFCKNPNKFGKNSNLASFDSIEEFDSVLSHMRLTSFYVWIGLYKDDKTNQLVWIDEKRLTFTNFWNPLSPDSPSIQPGNKTAFFVSSNPYVNGHWRLISNLMNLPFVCRTDPFMISSPNDHIESNKCLSTHKEYNGNCYKYYSEPLSFLNAYHSCKRDNSELLTLSDTFEEYFIKSYMQTKNATIKLIWMGFNVSASKYMMMNWTTPEGVPIYYTHWKRDTLLRSDTFYKDDSPHSEIDGCYVLDSTSGAVGQLINNAMYKVGCEITVPYVCKHTIEHDDNRFNKLSMCALSSKNRSYELDVTKTRNDELCIRWDIVKTSNTLQFHVQTFLFSSVPFNKDGYLSYSLNRCSELKNNTGEFVYGCYVYKDGKYHFEECHMNVCGYHKYIGTSSNRTVLAILIGVTTVLLLFCALFFFRQRILANYRFRSLLAHGLGRFQPDCLRNTHRPHTSVTGGVGFSNPVYTALEPRY